MNRSFTILRTLMLPAVLSLLLPLEGFAQSRNADFGSAALSNLRGSNSAARFSVSNIQASIRNQSVSSAGVIGVNRQNFLSSAASSSVLNSRPKPFTGASQGPTISPYLALSGPRASATDYYDIVRPQQQQQQTDRQRQIQTYRKSQQLNEMAAQAPYSTTGDENQAPTGHAAVFQSLGSFQNTGGYFPPPSEPKKR